VRKLRELLYAIEMERTLGKARILELYLNTVDWGPGLCGARGAARAYFGKPPARLTALEAAWLAGVLRNPHAAWDQQFQARQPDRERAIQVLMQMRDWPKRERERFAAQPLAFARAPVPQKGRGAGTAPAQRADSLGIVRFDRASHTSIGTETSSENGRITSPQPRRSGPGR
jgi:membrane peptidoglycan carboxypeptidase